MLLGDFLTLQRGFDITRKEQRPGPYWVISSSGPSSQHAESRVRGPGVVIGRKGSLGGVYFSEADFWPHDTTLWVKDFKGNDPLFTYYLLKTLGLERFDVGAANPTLNRNHLHLLSVTAPSLPAQQKIATVLSAYDELIDNNLRRIEILQETAQTVYREWFVNFRFPGHEHVPLVDSPLGPIPDGWERSPLFDAADVAFGFTFKSESFAAVGPMKVVRIRDIAVGDSSTYTDEATGDRYQIRDDDVLIGMDGDFHMSVWAAGDAWLNQRVTRVRPKVDLPVGYLFQALRLPIREFNDSIVGTTVAHLGKRHLETIHVLIPPAPLIAEMRSTFDPITRHVRNLKVQVRNLRATRDLLLPKLVSGEVDVSGLDINTEWLAS